MHIYLHLKKGRMGIRTGTEAGDPDIEELHVRYPVTGLHLSLLPAPGAAVAPRRHAVADEQRRSAGARAAAACCHGLGRSRRASGTGLGGVAVWWIRMGAPGHALLPELMR